MHATRQDGFSLIEILVVVILIGLIAAITVPLIGGYVKGADEVAFRSDLAMLRSAIEMFAADHNGAYPSSVGDGTNSAGTELAFAWHLTKASNAAGETNDVKNDSYPFGPYIPREIPKITVGPLLGDNDVKITTSSSTMTADTDPSEAWKYSRVTGQIIANTRWISADGSTQYDAL